jgi:hypothetical protein
MTYESKPVPCGSYQVSFVHRDDVKLDGYWITKMFFKIQKGERTGEIITLDFNLTGKDRDEFSAYVCAIFRAVGQEIIQSAEQLLNKNFFLTVKEQNGKNIFSAAESVSEYYLRKAKI